MNDHRNTASSKPILVVGSTGKTGRRVLERLQGLDLPTRQGSRTAPIPFDWADPATWAPALRGVRAAYVAFVPDLAVPGAPQAIHEFTRLAKEAGVEHVVLLSGRGEPEARRCETILEQSGLRWNVVRASWFDQNFSEGFLQGMILEGTVALPTAGVREPFVDADDIADVAVAALTRPELHDRVFEVTGPRLLTFAEAVAEVAEASGRDVRFVPVPHEEFLSSLSGAGVPDEYVQLLDYLFREVLDGRNESIATGVRDALGRPPRDIREYAGRAHADGAWSRNIAV